MNGSPQKIVRPRQDPVRNKAPLVAGLMLIFIGIYFLLERLRLLPPVRTSWPVILVIVGVALVATYIVSYGQRE